MAKPDYMKALSALKSSEPEDSSEVDDDMDEEPESEEGSDPTYLAMAKEVFPDFDDEKALAFKRLVSACMSNDEE